MKNQKNVAENLKQKLNNFLKNKFYYLLPLIFMISGQMVFAENEGQNEEFLDAAMQIQVPTDEMSNIQEPAPIEPFENEPVTTSNNGLKDVFNNFSDKLQDFGNSIGSNFEHLTGGNVVLTKIIIGLILVLMSIVVITVLVLIAKKVIFKNQKVVSQNLFENKNQNIEYDENDEEYEEIEEYEEVDADEYEDEGTVTPIEPSKEDEKIKPTTQNKNSQVKASSINLSLSNEPKTIADAMQNFLSITE